MDKAIEELKNTVAEANEYYSRKDYHLEEIQHIMKAIKEDIDIITTLQKGDESHDEDAEDVIRQARRLMRNLEKLTFPLLRAREAIKLRLQKEEVEVQRKMCLSTKTPVKPVKTCGKKSPKYESREESTICKKACWDHSMTKLLITLVNEKTPLVPLRIRSKAAMYDEISNDMLDRGYLVSSQQCADKMKSLMKGLKSTLFHNKKTGVTPKTCPYMTELEQLLVARQHCITPLCIIGTETKPEERSYESNGSIDHTFPNDETSTSFEYVNTASTNDTRVTYDGSNSYEEHMIEELETETNDIANITTHRVPVKRRRPTASNKILDSMNKNLQIMQKRITDQAKKRQEYEEKILDLYEKNTNMLQTLLYNQQRYYERSLKMKDEFFEHLTACLKK